MNTLNYALFLELIQEAFAIQVVDQFGNMIEDAYLTANRRALFSEWKGAR